MDRIMIPSPTAMPAAIAGAIAEVMSQITRLPKSEHNGHGGYNFASIDNFLAAIGPLCSAAGLLIIQDEESLEILDRGGKGWLRITFAFTLAHSSGAVWERPIRRTVLLQIAGPQTTGSAQSYALKMVMRSLFQIPTGDMEDADFMPKDAMPARQERTFAPPAPPPVMDAGGEPVRIAIPRGEEGLQIGRWTRMALDILTQAQDASWRSRWLEMHTAELAEVAKTKPEYSARVERMAKVSSVTQ